MHKVLSGILMACALAGCGTSATTVKPAEVATEGKPKVAAAGDAKPKAPDAGTQQVAARPDNGEPAPNNGTWIGAAGASDFILPGVSDTFLGVWVDVPSSIKKVQVPAAVALVMDTSGSMAGPKMENAKSAARALVGRLADGDILTIATFDDQARERVTPTVLSAETRKSILSLINELNPNGGTALFDGMRLGEARAMSAPATHAIRRVVVISDGIANVGPTSTEILGALATRGADQGVQVTAIGVGLDYDENTLNALAIRSSGRLYHLAETNQMASILEREMGLLKTTAVTSAVVEIVPAPGVQLLGADGVRADWNSGSLRVPLGTMFGGQHREMLVRVRVTARPDGTHPLASVRLHFADPSEGNLSRVQEVIARYQVTADAKELDRHANAKTQTIMAVQEAGRLAMEASKKVNDDKFDAAEKDLAVAEARLRQQAQASTSAAERRRIEGVASNVAKARAGARAAAAAPPAARPAAKRASALESNATSMDAYGY
jgi:Ca-activated chloride channel family protein